MKSMLFAAALLLGASAEAATFTMLHGFNELDGSYPDGSLVIDSAGNLFGTTRYGGEWEQGNVFRLNAGGGLTILSDDVGQEPRGGLVMDASRNLFGTTFRGGVNIQGSIFRLDPNGGVSTLHSFNGSDGRYPSTRLLLDASGNLFGVTEQGGKWNQCFGFSGCGTIFRLEAGGSLTTLRHFGFDPLLDLVPIGGAPNGGLVADASGNLFGTTSVAGSSGSTGHIFRLDAGSGLTRLDVWGGSYQGALVIEGGGNLIGIDRTGGAFGLGSIFRLNAGSEVPTILHSFNGGDGREFFGDLIMDAAGNLFGTSRRGGAFDQGTIFRLDTSGVFTLLHVFDGINGGLPEGGLVADAAGNLFGTTTTGGAAGAGTIYRLSGTGFVTGGGAVIPEPATWAMLIAGFGLVGAGLRIRRRREAVERDTVEA